MNTTIKVALGFAIGAACGGGGVYLWLRKKFEDETQAEIDEYRRIARKRIQAAEDYVADKLDEKEAEEYIRMCDENDGAFTDYTSYFDSHSGKHVEIDTTSIKSELNKLSREVHDDGFDSHMAEREHPEDDEADEDDIHDMLDSAERLRILNEARANDIQPYFIDEDDFTNDRSWYSKICLTWYTGDGFVTDDQDDIIPDDEVDRILGGRDFEKWFDKDPRDPDVCHVRNDVLAIDYEICRANSSYSEVYPEDLEPATDEGSHSIEDPYPGSGPVIRIS